MSDTTAELGLQLAVDADDTADYLVTSLRNSLNVLDGVFSSSTGHNHNGAHQGGNLVFGVLNTTSITFANGATLGPFATGNQLRFQSTNVSFSGAITVDGTATLVGLTVNGNPTVNGTITTGAVSTGALTVTGAATLSSTLNVSGVTTVTALNASSAISAPDVTTTTGWHRNNAAGTGLFNQALNVGLRFDSGRNGPIMHGGSYDGARVHGTPHVRAGYFTTPAVANGAETTISVPFNPVFPAGATPNVQLTLLRGVADHMEWRIGLEFGQGGVGNFVARVKNETGSTQSVSVAWLAYWNE